MSVVEGELQQAEQAQKSSIKVSKNAKGEAVFEVKCYEGVEQDEMDRLRAFAVGQYNALARELPRP